MVERRTRANICPSLRPILLPSIPLVLSPFFATRSLSLNPAHVLISRRTSITVSVLLLSTSSVSVLRRPFRFTQKYLSPTFRMANPAELQLGFLWLLAPYSRHPRLSTCRIQVFLEARPVPRSKTPLYYYSPSVDIFHRGFCCRSNSIPLGRQVSVSLVHECVLFCLINCHVSGETHSITFHL